MKVNQGGVQFLFVISLLWNLGYCNRRQKKAQRSNYHLRIPKFDIYKGDIIPSDVQISIILYKDQPKRVHYLSPASNGPLAVTIMACSSPIEWSFELNNSSVELNISSRPADFIQTKNYLTVEISTEYFVSKAGMYTLSLTTKKSHTYAHMYISTERGGSLALRNSSRQKIELLRRQKRGSLSAKWEPSLIDPQGTEYCIVVSQTQNYNTLCTAETDIYGVSLQSSSSIKQLTSSSQTIISWQDTSTNSDQDKYPLIACVGPKTQYTATNLKHKQQYYFTVIAIDKQTNLTYAHAKNVTRFDKRINPIHLKDGKSLFTNLKRFDGIGFFRFRTRKKLVSSLNIFIMPCGKAVYVDVTKDKTHIVSRKRVEKFDKISISNPIKNGKYNIKVTSINIDEVVQTFGVEIFVTTKSTNIPFPDLPSQTSVVEYESLKKCDSVTIGWLPSPGHKKLTYCIIVQEATIKESNDLLYYGMPNQCGLDNRLKKSINFALKFCKETRQSFQNVITEKITHLSPGKSYIVQVTVNKPNGKILSYDLLQVRTSSTCQNDL